MKILKVSSFTFCTYAVDTKRSMVIFTYRVRFQLGIHKTFTDRLFLKDVSPESWVKVPPSVLEKTLQSLLLMIGINYWSAFPTKNIHIEGFTLSRAQARFWESVYLNGLAEYFYLEKIDFRDLISFPYDDVVSIPAPTRLDLPKRALLLNGAGKDSILSAEMLKKALMPFDFFVFSPTRAHERIAKLVGAHTISVTRRLDRWVTLIPGAYPSVSTFTFTAALLAELLGYNSIVFSNERSADVGNLEYLGLEVNHQWCKSSEAEKMINEYIQSFITPDISTYSLLRKYSELEIVRRFVEYPQYLFDVTSCNNYFCLTPIEQRLVRRNYWCTRCPKCIFLFACFSAFLPKEKVLSMFGANLYTKQNRLRLFRRILGIEGFKPLDCVGEPEEMILAMHYASRRQEYAGEPIMQFFEEHFSSGVDFDEIARRTFTD